MKYRRAKIAGISGEGYKYELKMSAATQIERKQELGREQGRENEKEKEKESFKRS